MQVFGITRLLFPSRNADASQVEARLGPYGEQFTIPIGSGFYSIAAEGGYYKATNTTFNTGTSWNVAAGVSFSETAASIIVRNTATSGGKDIYLDYVRLVCVAAGTGNTNLNVVMQIDNGNRYSSGGSNPTPVNMNDGVATASIADVRFGAIVSTGAVTARKLLGGSLVLKTTAPAANDLYLFNFGSVDTVASAPGVAMAIPCGPVYLPAGSNYSFLMHLFSASQTVAPTGFYEIGWIER